MKNEEEEEEDIEAREGLQLLLGGISFEADALKQAFQKISSASSDDNDEKQHAENPAANNNSMKITTSAHHHHHHHHHQSYNSYPSQNDDVVDDDSANLEYIDDADDDGFDGMFSLAFKSSGYGTLNGRVERPSVRVVNMDTCTSRRCRRGKQQQQEHQKLGNGMIATRFSPKGDIVYTERAAVACQMPDFSSSSCCTTASNVHHGQQSGIANVRYSVRACQWCFRSLEPASSCSTTKMSSSSSSLSNHGNDTITGATTAASVIELPLAQRLWPIPEIEWIDNNNNNNEQRSLPRRDQHGRVHCPECLAWFCSDTCCQSFEKALGSHCLVTRSTQSLQYHADNADNDDDDDDDDSSEPAVQPAVALAVRMFCQALQHYRTTGGNLVGTYLDGLCGEATEISPLELGIRVQENTTTSTRNSCSSQQSYYYTLDPVYRQLLQVWNITTREQEALSLEYFHQLAVKAARNGIGLQTQCPFQTYYAGILRQCGRGTAQSHEYRNLVAKVLSSSFGNCQGQGDASLSSSSSFTTASNDTTALLPVLQSLDRDMDRRVSERVAPEIVALFPLTARINHSCQPNAQVQGQVFCDCHLDLVATQDIHAGQEITISYIHGSNSTSSSNANTTTSSTTTARPRGRRRRELQAKYLFECHCPLCSGKGC